MITSDHLRDLRTKSDDYEETEALKAEFQKCRAERQPFFLTTNELDRIFRWKLHGQYGRQEKLRAKTSDNCYRAVTEAAFRIVLSDFDCEAAIRLGFLVALPGVAISVASSILALTEPTHYCVIDFRGWRAVFDEKRNNFTIKNYLRYRAEVARLASELGWSVQETDLAIWEYDRRKHP